MMKTSSVDMLEIKKKSIITYIEYDENKEIES